MIGTNAWLEPPDSETTAKLAKVSGGTLDGGGLITNVTGTLYGLLEAPEDVNWIVPM